MKILWLGLAGLNFLSFLMMGLDKRQARRGGRRISERTLFIAAACFGAFGGLLGMHLFHHKTRHWQFRVFFPAMAVVQTALLVYVVLKYV